MERGEVIDIKEKAVGHAGDVETSGIYLNGKVKKRSITRVEQGASQKSGRP